MIFIFTKVFTLRFETKKRRNITIKHYIWSQNSTNRTNHNRKSQQTIEKQSLIRETYINY